MRSEPQSIDDFFRKKEEAYQQDTGDPGIHWERMKGLLAPAPPPARLLTTRRFIRYLGGFSIVTIVSLVTVTTLHGRKKAAVPRAATTRTSQAPTAPAGRPATAGASARTMPPGAFPTAAASVAPPVRQADAQQPDGSKERQAATNSRPPVATASSPAQGQRTVQPGTRPDRSIGELDISLLVPKDGRSLSPSDHLIPPTQAATLPGEKEHLIIHKPDDDSAWIGQTGVAEALVGMNAFYKALEKPKNVFTVDVERETVLNGREGTRLIIPPHAFATSKGVVRNELVTLVLEEYYTYEDILAAKLTTTSGGEQLISHGMVKLTAHCNGRPVNVARGQSLRLEMPAPRFDGDMQLFRGNRSSIKDAYKAAFVDNRMIDTVRYKKLEADENGDIDWIPEGQVQQNSGINVFGRDILVFNPYGDPYRVHHGKKKFTAWYYVSTKCPLSDSRMKKLIIAHANFYYDRIRIRRVTAASYRYSEDRASIAGDSVVMTFAQALRKKLLSPTDSLLTLQRLRADSAAQARGPEAPNKYRFVINSLGYFNSDKFFKGPKPSSDVLFAFDPGEGFERSSMVTQLVFTRYKSVLKGNYRGNRISFGRIPPGEPVKLLCLGLQNGRYMACIQDLNAGQEEIGQLNWQETTPELFKQQLKTLSAALP